MGLPALNSDSRTSTFSPSIRNGKPFTTPLMLLLSMLCVMSRIVPSFLMSLVSACLGGAS